MYEKKMAVMHIFVDPIDGQDGQEDALVQEDLSAGIWCHLGDGNLKTSPSADHLVSLLNSIGQND